MTTGDGDVRVSVMFGISWKWTAEVVHLATCLYKFIKIQIKIFNTGDVRGQKAVEEQLPQACKLMRVRSC